MSLDLLTGPAAEPLDVATAKLWARIDADLTQFDALLPMMIAAARQGAEQITGSKLIDQVWRLTLDDWPSTLATVPLFPVSSLAISFWTGSAWTTLSPTAYTVMRNGYGVRVATNYGQSYGGLAARVGPRVRFDFTCGYGADATFVPQSIRQWMAAQIALWIRSPEAATERYAVVKNPFLDTLLEPFNTYL